MGDTNLEARSLSTDIIRLLFSTLDRPAYWLLGLSYQLFFNVASASLFNGETIMNFYKRIQLIIGVYMMFQLAVIILKGIMNPDSFTDSKSGAGSIIKRVMISLVLLTLIVPISIPKQNKNEWEKQLNNNGLLFGTLYSLQNRILNTNTLGRLILGTDDSAEIFDDGSGDSDGGLAKSTILKGFYRINLKPGKDDPTKNEHRVCEDIDDEILNAYTRLDAEPGEIIGMVQEHCTPNFDIPIPGVDFWTGRERYIFAYMPFISSVVGFIFVFILIDFTVQIAVRAVKLAVLRLLAPIPIISYMDPKGSKDGAFNAWVKALTSTYLDLFLRLATIYFVLFLVQDMIVNGIYIQHSKGILGVVSFIFILVGLFIFAKQAPKFIKQIFGIKDEGDKLFSGIGNLASIGAAAVGAIGSGIASAKASRLADKTRQSFGEDVDPTALHNRGKHLLAGFAGALGGLGTGVKAGMTAKDHALRSTMEAMQKRNVQTLTAGDSGSTFLGRAGATASRMFTGDGPGASLSREISSLEGQQKALKSIKDRMSSEMVKQDWTYGKLGIKDSDGKDILANYKSFMAAKKAAEAAGANDFTFRDSHGNVQNITLEQANMQEGFLLKNNEDDYIKKAINVEIKAEDGRTITGKQDRVLVNLIADAVKKGRTVSDRDSVTSNGLDELEIEITNKKRQNIINEQNDRYSSNKKG